MAGKPFKVGRFAHSLRVRLMREHIGIDVDALDDEDTNNTAERGHLANPWNPNAEQRRARGSVPEKSRFEGKTKNKMRDAVRQGNIILYFKPSSDVGLAVIQDSEDLGTEDVVQGLCKSGLERVLPDPALQEGRSNYTHDDGKTPCFAHPLVATLEEKVVAENQPPTKCTHGMFIEDVERGVESVLVETKVENAQLFGVPTDASLAPRTSNHVRMGKNDTNVEEQKVPRARHLLRKYPNVKLGQSPRTVPTHKPKYDAGSFEDPLCDEFWEDIWVACAVHNVGVHRFPESKPSPIDQCYFRPRSSVGFFASCRTTSSQHGSITRNSSHITSVYSSQYANCFYFDCS
jgi:phospholipase D1/2